MRFNEIYEGLLQGKKYRLSYWNKNEYIYYDKEHNLFKDDTKNIITLTASHIINDIAWEEYIEPINYEKCIGCLCEFWSDDRFSYRSIGILTKIYDNIEHKFANQMDINYKYCKPIKPDKIKFYKGDE